MNKKISLVFVLPLLCSCHGNAISPDNALTCINKIRSEYDYGTASYNHFTLISERKLEEDNQYIFESYDKAKMYYHSFYLENQTLISEDWTYVQTNSDGDTNIYTVSRKPNEYSDDKPILVEKVPFTIDAWNIEDKFLRFDINQYHSQKLTESEEIIKSYKNELKNKTLTLKSQNQNSFYLDYVQKTDDDLVTTDIKIEFSNKLFISSKIIDGKDSEHKVSCSYDSFDIIYPKLNK